MLMVTSDTRVGSQLLLCTSVTFTTFILAEKNKDGHKRLKSHLITQESLKPKLCRRRCRYYILFTSPCEQSTVCIIKNTAFKIRELIRRGGEKMSLTCCTSVSENNLTRAVSGCCSSSELWPVSAPVVCY